MSPLGVILQYLIFGSGTVSLSMLGSQIEQYAAVVSVVKHCKQPQIHIKEDWCAVS